MARISRKQFDDANEHGCGSVLARQTIRAYADQQDVRITELVNSPTAEQKVGFSDGYGAGRNSARE